MTSEANCPECGENTKNKELCPHCTAEYHEENNERYDSLKSLDIEAFDRACQKWKEIKESDNVFNRGI